MWYRNPVDTIRRVLDFWFGATDSPEFGTYREAWFTVDFAFDQSVRERFLDDYRRAAADALDGLAATAEGALALVVMLDQFPRNMFRGTAAAFATDSKALGIADAALACGFDRTLRPLQRLFLYLPFEHSEQLADQERSVALFQALGDAKLLDAAVRHRDIICRFGRFPHRNKALGRASTPEEAAFLAEPGSSF
jgi:uncharacterized protein (DUF924 family)